MEEKTVEELIAERTQLITMLECDEDIDDYEITKRIQDITKRLRSLEEGV